MTSKIYVIEGGSSLTDEDMAEDAAQAALGRCIGTVRTAESLLRMIANECGLEIDCVPAPVFLKRCSGWLSTAESLLSMISAESGVVIIPYCGNTDDGPDVAIPRLKLV